MKTRISRSVLDAILAEAAASPAREVCGILLGAPLISGHRPAENVAANPADSFEIDPAALFAAIRAERAGEGAVAGYYHSHPSGSPEPSARDRAMAAVDGRLWIIVGGGAAKGWRATDGGFAPVDLLVEE